MTVQQILETLEARRQALKYSRPKLSRLSGVPAGTLQQWKGRRHGPNVGAVTQVADALGMELVLREGREPRLLTFEELRRPAGFGFLEEYVIDDEGADFRLFGPCCWTWRADRIPYGLRIVTPEGGVYLTPTEETYNVPGGWRIWTKAGAAGKRVATPWNGGGK